LKEKRTKDDNDDDDDETQKPRKKGGAGKGVVPLIPTTMTPFAYSSNPAALVTTNCPRLTNT
jgi:hypothetical protein